MGLLGGGFLEALPPSEANTVGLSPAREQRDFCYASVRTLIFEDATEVHGFVVKFQKMLGRYHVCRPAQKAPRYDGSKLGETGKALSWESGLSPAQVAATNYAHNHGCEALAKDGGIASSAKPLNDLVPNSIKPKRGQHQRSLPRYRLRKQEHDHHLQAQPEAGDQSDRRKPEPRASHSIQC